MKLQKELTVLLSASIVVLLVVSPQTFAGPTPPVVSGSVADFTGDQSDGIWPVGAWSCPPVYTYNVYDLTTNITAAGQSYGIKLSRQGADGTTGPGTWSILSTSGGQGTLGDPGGETSPTVLSPQVNFDGGDYGITMSTFFALGISTGSYGGDGGAGGSPIWHLFAAYGGNGGDGGLGLPVTVTSDGDIQTNGWLSIGIGAESRGGNGGNGGSASAAGVAYGGHGGAGGNADEVAVTNDSHIQATGTAAVGIFASSAGGNGGAGGSAESIAYGKGGDGGPGGSGGPVTIHNHGSIVVTSTLPAESEWTGPVTGGIFGQSHGGAGGDGGYGGSVVGLGGGALGSGPGGDVAVDNTGDIQTSGRDVHGIFAQSVGGFAGGAGDAGGVVSWGASIESAGDGGNVLITNSGNIQTLGAASEGLLAQSVGGGGGSGSSSSSLVSIGGDGGSNGDGGRVIVENTGDITTVGDGSASIFAQSIGGGGGAVGGHGGTSNSPFFSMGGNGNSGGSGERVIVNNSGNLETSGIDSSAIFAQSVGGGGGAGGAAYDTGFFFAYSMGGDSTLGGDGEQVYVDSTVDASIFTEGAFSHGIHAQSLGGGGGSGGNAYNLILGLAFSGSLAIGGDAGGGGNGSAINLTSGSTIITLGDHAHGLYAQSVGGGGGSGGNATNWTVNLDVPSVDIPDISIAASLGGTGGTGGSGDAVTVNNTGDINTSGFRSYGIFGQSLGGGGGDGGDSITGDIAINSMGFSIAIGGDGVEGGNGRTVDVDNSGNITTQGDYAYGIIGQSIGGGGGAGGNSTALIADIELLMDLEDLLSPDANFKLSVGGMSGGGGNGSKVEITNHGNISTEGNFANGIQAQSIGGGGGAGGETTSIQVELTTNPLDYIPFFSFMSADLNILIGSDGGDGGDGGEVVVTNDGNISTGGNFANGILAQSVGGGGGTAGYIHDDSYRLTSPTSAMTLGAKGGGGGNGDKVEVTNNGNISTEGDFTNGILAQSIGGGGGTGGLYQDTTVPPEIQPFLDTLYANAKFSIGGSIGAGGNGGEVNVTNDGNIGTEGNFSNGILAQSVGGGGGTGGYIHVDPDGFTDLTSVMVFEGSSSGGGDGGDVTVVNNGDITTDGGFAHGILAQSIGGGGGFGGISEDGGISTLDFGSTANGIFVENTENTDFGVGFAGSAGGSGSAGAVSVTHTGSITTLGDMSHGILAQSAAGSGAAGPVTVTLASEIMTDGVDSDGIHAQSVGGSGNGDISINIGGGTVRGGSGAGAGVNIDGGAINTFTNAGSISALSGLSIIGSVGDDTVYNNGIVTGIVDLGSGVNAFNNNLTGTFNSGATVNLDEGNRLTNTGVFSPGGSGTVLKTTLTGDFELASGLFEIEIGGFTPGSFDLLDITGTAFLTGGNINLSFLPGYDIVTDVGPGESLELSFLNAFDIDSFNSVIAYNFGVLPYFQFNVFQMDNNLIFEATNTVPLPGAVLLGSIGLGFAGWRLRRTRQSAPRS